MTPPPPVSGPGRGSFPPSGVPPQPGRKAGRKPPGKRRTGLIVGLSTGAAVLLAFILLLFPRRIRYESEDDPTTKQARMPAYSISISCNQGVREVYYALNPSDPMQTDRYRPVSRSGSASGGFFNKTVSLRNLNLKPGNNTLYLCTNTLFGRSAPQKFVLTRMTGYAGRVDPDAAQKLNDETAIAGNELIVVMERGSARREIERIAAEYGADIIGELPLIDE